MQRLAVIFLIPISLFAQQLAYSFSVDTSIYIYNGYIAIRGPGNESYFSTSQAVPTDILVTYNKKGTDQFDIFSFSGKVGSSTIPSSAIPSDYYINRICFSQSFIDADSGWEAIVWYDNASGSLFKVFDETGTQLLSDTGSAWYGFDGQSTYVWAQNRSAGNFSKYKAWRFRSNVSAGTSHYLSKSASMTPGPIMTYMPGSGDLRVNLQPSTGGTSIQIFDMLGRQVYQQLVQNVKEQTSIVIPSSGLPASSFVSKVSNNSGTFVNKTAPVR